MCVVTTSSKHVFHLKDALPMHLWKTEPSIQICQNWNTQRPQFLIIPSYIVETNTQLLRSWCFIGIVITWYCYKFIEQRGRVNILYNFVSRKYGRKQYWVIYFLYTMVFTYLTLRPWFILILYQLFTDAASNAAITTLCF